MKNQSKHRKERNCNYILLSFLLTGVLACTVYTILGVAPFGNASILRVDLFHQYAPFLEELRSRILNGQSLFYSWEAGLGKDFLTQTAYYAASPLDFLVLLSPRKYISEFMLFLITLKMCLCGASFTAFLKKRFNRNEWSIVIFGLLYAFCSFMTCYYWNVMWLDTVALFPMVALGVHTLIEENRFGFYYICLTLTMIVNFYLAVLVCVFIALYFVLSLMKKYTITKDGKVMLQRCVRFGIVSIICAMSATFILLPVAIALGQTATSEAAFPSLSIYQNVFQMVTCHFLGTVPSVLARNEDLPNVYCGVFTMMLLPVYFGNRRILKKEKILNAVFLGFAILCCIVRPLDFMIHGMHFPSNLPHRFTFIYSFMLLVIAYEAYQKIRDCEFRIPAITGGAYIAMMLLSEYAIVPRLSGMDVTLSGFDIILNIVLILIYLLIIYLMQNGKQKTQKLLFGIVSVMLVGELLFSACDGIEDFADYHKYIGYLDGTDAAMAAIKEQDDDLFYRTDFRRLHVINEGSIYHFNGFSQFSSLAPGGISSFIKHIGIASTGNSYRYYDPTPLVNAMFNMKYLLNRDNEMANSEHYDYLGQFDNVFAYKNQRCLPLGFLVDPAVNDWNTEEDNPFMVQNEFVKLATAETEDMFTMIDADYIEEENMNVTLRDGKNNDFDYTLDHPENLSLVPRVSAKFTSEKDQYLYLYVDAANASRFVYHTSRENQDRELACGNSIIDIGQVYAGEEITIEFTLTKRGKFETQYRPSGNVRIFSAVYDDAVFDRAYQELAQKGMTLTEFEDTHFEGTVHADSDQLLFLSVPYVDGWSVKVDGEAVEKVGIGDKGVIGVKVPAGDHTIELTYRLKGFALSVVISLMGFVLILLYKKQKWF